MRSSRKSLCAVALRSAVSAAAAARSIQTLRFLGTVTTSRNDYFNHPGLPDRVVVTTRENFAKHRMAASFGFETHFFSVKGVSRDPGGTPLPGERSWTCICRALCGQRFSMERKFPSTLNTPTDPVPELPERIHRCRRKCGTENWSVSWKDGGGSDLSGDRLINFAINLTLRSQKPVGDSRFKTAVSKKSAKEGPRLALFFGGPASAELWAGIELAAKKI